MFAVQYRDNMPTTSVGTAPNLPKSTQLFPLPRTPRVCGPVSPKMEILGGFFHSLRASPADDQK